MKPKNNANALTDRELHEQYDEMMNGVCGTVKIGGYEYNTAHALKLVDPTAYRCGFADWLSVQCDDEFLVEIDGEYFDANECTDDEKESV